MLHLHHAQSNSLRPAHIISAQTAAVKRGAVFVRSQRHGGAAVPVLFDLVRRPVPAPPHGRHLPAILLPLHTRPFGHGRAPLALNLVLLLALGLVLILALADQHLSLFIGGVVIDGTLARGGGGGALVPVLAGVVAAAVLVLIALVLLVLLVLLGLLFLLKNVKKKEKRRKKIS